MPTARQAVRASYREAIAWIANNEGDLDPDDIEATASMITVALVADLWKKSDEDVAVDIANYCRRNWSDS